MDYQALIAGPQRYGSTERDICTHAFCVEPERIRENVVIAPWWEPSVLPGLGEAQRISPQGHSIGVWDIRAGGIDMTYIKTGIGAPMFLEGLFPLGVTPCKRVVFVGSVGALDPAIGIGDIVVPEYSICGDGTSRYLASDDLAHDVFGEKVYPDRALFDTMAAETARLCDAHGVKWHVSRNFSIDTIMAQFAHIDTIVGMGCNVIEMETAVAFRAAEMMGISLAALFSVSDNTMTSKSLVSGRTEEEMAYRAFTRRTLFPQIILSVLGKAG